MINYFTKMGNPTPGKEISIHDVEDLIKHHPQKDEILKLHKLPVKCDEYNKIKTYLPCVTPHAAFENYKRTENIKSLSSYMYYDVDVYNTTHSIESYYDNIIKTHQDKISLAGRSVGNRGLFIYVKIDNAECLNKDNFNRVYDYIKNDILTDVTVDNSAKGITRYQIIPYDPYIYTNHSASLNIPVDIYNNSNTDNADSNYKYSGNYNNTNHNTQSNTHASTSQKVINNKCDIKPTEYKKEDRL